MNYVRKKDKTEMKSFWRNYLFGRHNAVCFNIKSKKIRITNKDRDIFEKSYFKIEGDTLQKLGKCCRNWCVTEYILLISAISLLLAKNTNCKDVIIGTYVPGRDNTDHIPTNNIIGLFTKMFPFRFNIEGELSFKEYVKLQIGNFSKLLEYQESTQDEIYGALEFEDLIKGQLFNLVFNYIFEYERQIDKFKIKSTEIGNEPKVFPYYITAVEKKDCIVINTTYLKKIYSKEDIKIIEDEFKNIISKILHNEDCIISNML